MNYTLILIVLYAIFAMFSIILVIFYESSSRKIVIEVLEETIDEFHKKYIESSYQLRVMNLSERKLARKAIRTINRNKEEYYMIPEGTIMFVNMCVSILNNYDGVCRGLFKIIKILLTVIVAIQFALKI